MLCERCNKNEAKIHLIKIINGKKTETLLCENCAKELSDIPLNNALMSGNKFNFQNILSGFFERLDKPNKIEVVCKKCGLTYSQFKKTGILGCSECYESFEEPLKQRLKKIQGNIEHVGKIPEKEHTYVIERKRLKRLKEELNTAIVEEEYERAAVIRDKIKLLESTKGGVNSNE